MKRKRSRVYLDVKEIPEKINEIISYLSMEFSRNGLFDREDLVQDLYLEYLQSVHDHPNLASQAPGYFFIRFKWLLLTKWRKRVTEINKEWEYKIKKMGYDPNDTQKAYESETQVDQPDTKYLKHFKKGRGKHDK